MKRFFLLTLASAALLGASAAPVKTYEVKSPDGRLALVLTAGERLSFTVARDGETLVAPSEMALTLSTGEVLGESPRVRSARRRAVTETIDAPLYRQSRFDAAYNELDLRLRGDYGILARAYDDGVCYRFYTERDGELTIVDETAQLNFEGDPSAYIPYSKTEIPMRTSFENTYEYAPLSKFRTQTVAFMPVLVDLGERGYVLYTESDVEAYPGVYLTYDKEVFSGTIASNLRFGNDNATDEEIRRAAKIAQAEDFIEEKEEKYDSPIAQGGSNVSGGQKQRLAIARAIAKNPKIFIFDDSFSALDMKTDAALRKALAENVKDSTVIIVAQRISTILHAEQILVLDEGRIVGRGTHEELLTNCEVYRQIAKSQLSAKELGLPEAAGSKAYEPAGSMAAAADESADGAAAMQQREQNEKEVREDA